ncbi:cyclase family protein [Jatrophihabitans sp.]|uniref:cyclase family protein n=1 Tax=Jatrophihabitans sp. TaxID=1932789 RepID=UPI0030C68A8A|nr:cyclase family protein [Jatrophihabitans sp.]
MAIDHDVSDFRSVGAAVSNWGRWGAGDQLGTVNLITPERRAAAARLVRRGEIFDLGMPLDANGPQRGGNRFNPIHRMTSIPSDGARPDGMLVSDDIVSFPLQCATQWDGLTHVGYDDRLYNDVPASAVTAARGAERNSFHLVAPHLIGRGVLVDVAAAKGVGRLAAGMEITPDDLDDALAHQGVQTASGDILLVRTGWYQHFAAGDAGTFMSSSTPGLGLACCAWLYEHDIAAVAADNYIVEVLPSRQPPAMYPLHMVAIRDMGLTLGEMFNLEELAVDCQSDGVFTFLLVGTGLKVTGSTGTPLTPVVVK